MRALPLETFVSLAICSKNEKTRFLGLSTSILSRYNNPVTPIETGHGVAGVTTYSLYKLIGRYCTTIHGCE